jgi:hypothetical protein
MLIIGLSGCGRFVSVYYKVINDEGTPVADAHVNVGYSSGYTWTESGKEYMKNGQTDTDGKHHYMALVPYKKGIIPFMHMDEIEDIFASVKKEGYYPTFAARIKDKDIEMGLWQKDTDPMLIMLRRIINPVPMYSKRATPRLPSLNGSYGYDLIEGDLVEPYGSGKVSDLIFHVSPKDHTKDKKNDSRNILFDITFSNKDDGIQPLFVQYRNAQSSNHLTTKFSHDAPQHGYFDSLNKADDGWREKYKNPDYQQRERYWNEEINYYIKVRTKEDGSAMYGWIVGFFRVDIWVRQESPNVEFRYAINPDRTTNVEFGKGLKIKYVSEHGESN